MLKKNGQRMRGIHASHTHVSHFLNSIGSAKWHDIHSVAHSARVVNIVGEWLCYRLVNCVIKVLWIAEISKKLLIMLISRIKMKWTSCLGTYVMNCCKLVTYHVVFCKHEMLNSDSRLQKFFWQLIKFVV